MESTDRLTDLMIRFAKNNNKPDSAVKIAKNFAEISLKNNNIDTAAKYILEVSNILKSDKKKIKIDPKNKTWGVSTTRANHS